MTTPPPLVLRGEEQLFYDRLREHELTFQRCNACSAVVFYLRTVCPVCGSEELELQTASGKGVLYSFTTQYRAAHPHFADDVPYTLALADMEEGFRAFASVIDCAEQDLRVGMPIEVVFDDVAEDLTLLRFRPRHTEDGDSA